MSVRPMVVYVSEGLCKVELGPLHFVNNRGALTKVCCAGAGGSGRSGGIKGEASMGKTTWASCRVCPVATAGAAERARRESSRPVVMLAVDGDVHLAGRGLVVGRLENMVGASSRGPRGAGPGGTKERGSISGGGGGWWKQSRGRRDDDEDGGDEMGHDGRRLDAAPRLWCGESWHSSRRPLE